jgi:hypothetical protein
MAISVFLSSNIPECALRVILGGATRAGMSALPPTASNSSLPRRASAAVEPRFPQSFAVCLTAAVEGALISFCRPRGLRTPDQPCVFYANHVSTSVAGDYYQAAFEAEENSDDPDGPYLLIQRQFEDPDDLWCYIATHDENCDVCCAPRLPRSRRLRGKRRFVPPGKSPQSHGLPLSAQPRQVKRI